MKANQLYINEIRIVRELGERIGYGNMIHIATALWTQKQRSDGIKRPPPRVAVVISEVYSKRREVAIKEIETLVDYIEANVPPRCSPADQLANILEGINEGLSEDDWLGE